jgi:hypothetical protein
MSSLKLPEPGLKLESARRAIICESVNTMGLGVIPPQTFGKQHPEAK